MGFYHASESQSSTGSSITSISKYHEDATAFLALVASDLYTLTIVHQSPPQRGSVLPTTISTHTAFPLLRELTLVDPSGTLQFPVPSSTDQPEPNTTVSEAPYPPIPQLTRLHVYGSKHKIDLRGWARRAPMLTRLRIFTMDKYGVGISCWEDLEDQLGAGGRSVSAVMFPHLEAVLIQTASRSDKCQLNPDWDIGQVPLRLRILHHRSLFPWTLVPPPDAERSRSTCVEGDEALFYWRDRLMGG